MGQVSFSIPTRAGKYQHKLYQRMLKAKGILYVYLLVAENFFGLLKASCCICKSSSPCSTSNKNSLTIWITTITDVLRQS